MSDSRILIVIPSYNERENIVRLCDRLLELTPQADVLVMDDNSPDGTAGVVREAQGRHGDRLLLQVRPGKGGRGSAVLDGFQWGLQRDYGLFFEMDADFSHKPEEIAGILEKITTCDMVIASRYRAGSAIHEWGLKRRVFSKGANIYARIVLGIPISDYTNGFRCYTRRAVEAIERDKILARGYVVLSEVAYQLHRKGMRIGEVSTVFVNRRRGASNLSFAEIKEAFLSVWRIRLPHLFSR